MTSDDGRRQPPRWRETLQAVGRPVRLIERAESLPWGPWQVLAVLAAVITVRNLLEIHVARNPAYEPLAAFVHYPLAYLGPFLALTLVLAGCAALPPARVARLMCLAWVLTLVPPAVDVLLHSGGHVPAIGYLHADPQDLSWIVVHFLDPSVSLIGTTPGIRVEAGLAVILGAAFVWLRGRRWWRGLLAAVLIYVVSLFFFTLPVLVRGLFGILVPRLTLDGILRGVGILYREGAETAPDSIGTLWLIPVVVVCGLIWAALERKAPEADRWLHGRFGASRLPGAPLLLAALLVAGTWTAGWLYLPLDAPAWLSVYDLLAPAGALATTLLLSAGALRAETWRDSAAPALLALLGGAGAAALGGAPALGLAVAFAALLPVGLRIPPERWEWPAWALCTGVAGLGAFVAGFALVVGPEALARLPSSLLAPVIAAGLAGGAFVAGAGRLPFWLRAFLFVALLTLSGLAVGSVALVTMSGLLAAGAALLLYWRERSGAGRPAWLAPLAAGAVILLATRGLSAGSFGQETLRDATRCVARLELIRGAELEQSGQAEQARRAYRQALVCQEGYAPAHEALGLMLLRDEDKPGAAVKHFQRALENRPGFPTYLNHLAAAWMEQGRFARALPLLEQAHGSSPRNLDVLFNLARTRTELGRSDDAVRAWREFVRAAGSRPSRLEDVRLAREEIRKLRRSSGREASGDGGSAKPAGR